jgi:hypothetical protein
MTDETNAGVFLLLMAACMAGSVEKLYGTRSYSFDT